MARLSGKEKNKRPSGRKKRDIRRQEILEIAVDVFFEFGYHKASINDISSRMGTTKAAIYYHFHNKEDILYTIVDEMANRILLELKSGLKSHKDPVQRLRALISSQIGFMKGYRKEVKILIEDKRFLGGDLGRLTREKEATIFHIYRSILEELKNDGRLKESDLTTATFGIFGMINWLYHWYDPKGKLPIEKLAENIVGILFHGLLADAEEG